jgi:VWFA-related protein
MARIGTLFGLLIVVLTSFAGTGDRPRPAALAMQVPQAQASPTPQQKPSQPAPAYESSTVLKAVTRLVVVDVVATDKKGDAVTDLEKNDFTVTEDGVEQEIRVFTFQQPAALPAKAAPVAMKLPDNVFTNIPTYATTNALNVVLLDALNTTMPHQAYARDQMIRYLQKMPENQPVAVYLLSSKLTLLQDFTTDPEILKGVMAKLKGKASPVLDNPAGGPGEELLPPGLADSGMVPASMLDAMMRFEQERTSFQTDMRISYTMAALSSIARSLSGYPGRKNLIWISEAFPLSIDPNMELSGDIFAGTRNYGPQVAAAADALIDAQIAVYPVDARGLEPYSVFDASNTGRDRFGRSLSRPGRLGNAISAESAQLQNAHNTMNEMADRTGGRAFYNRNDIDGAIRQSIHDGSTYYTLAYYPANKNWNGKFRKIQIKVRQPGIKLRHRLGYYALDPKAFAEQNKRQQATLFGEALSLDSPVSTGLKFKAGVIPPSKTQRKVMVNFALDPAALTFEGQGDGTRHATVDCAVQAYSSKGKLLKTEASTVNADVKPDTFARIMQTAFPCQQLIELPAGSYFLRLGVRDDRTGLMGTANAKVTVTPDSLQPASTEEKVDEKKP